jgi:hypothetical protein
VPPLTPRDPEERIFVITSVDIDGSLLRPATGEAIVESAINGLAWPHTERLQCRVGERVSWRWINAAYQSHPIHLHGFHFRTLANGGWNADRAYGPDEIHEVVTERLLPGGTSRREWVPTRAGAWLVHCHMRTHMVTWPRRTAAEIAADDHDPAHHVFRSMAGLVMGVTTVGHLDRGAGEDVGRARIPAPGGPYGPLIVLEHGARHEPRPIPTSSAGGAVVDGARQAALNGQVDPSPREFRAGTTDRLRLINVQADFKMYMEIREGEEYATWCPLVKDGADLPDGRRGDVPARVLIGSGETYDFEWTPRWPLEAVLSVYPSLDPLPRREQVFRVR